MKRTQIYLEASQDEQLGQRAAAEGTTRSALIRRAIDRYLHGEHDRTVPLARFRSALREAAGAAPYLGDGARYVENLRGADRAREEEIEARRRS